MADLDAAKKRLVEALKDRIQRYWELLKSWYRRKVSFIRYWSEEFGCALFGTFIHH